MQEEARRAAEIEAKKRAIARQKREQAEARERAQSQWNSRISSPSRQQSRRNSETEDDSEKMVLSNGPSSVQDPAIQRAIAQVKKSGRKFDDRDFAPESMQWPRSIYNTLNRNSVASSCAVSMPDHSLSAGRLVVDAP